MEIRIKKIETQDETGAPIDGYVLARETPDGDEPITADILPSVSAAEDYAEQRNIKLAK